MEMLVLRRAFHRDSALFAWSVSLHMEYGNVRKSAIIKNNWQLLYENCCALLRYVRLLYWDYLLLQ